MAITFSVAYLARARATHGCNASEHSLRTEAAVFGEMAESRTIGLQWNSMIKGSQPCREKMRAHLNWACFDHSSAFECGTFDPAWPRQEGRSHAHMGSLRPFFSRSQLAG